ncbi:MAG: putative peptidoglycan lipid flippase [Chloroflexota bacterium]|nr:putative peptidoglycan lipid flippase [Chloroflexota bacterium]
MTALGSVARAGLIVSGAFLVSRLLGFLRLVVIGNAFGASAELDAWIAAFRIPDLVFQLVAAGALASALIPVISGLLATGEHERAWRVVSTVTNLMLVGLAILSVGLFVLAPVIDPIITPGFAGAQLDRTVDLTRIMLVSPAFLALGAVATSVLNAGGRFAVSALAPIVYNVAIIGAALLLGPSLGVDALAIGVVAGSIGNLLIQVPAVARIGYRYLPIVDASDAQARKALLLLVPRAVGLGVTQITFIVVTSLATLLGAGAVSDFNFAFAILQIPLGVIGVPLGMVLLPSLSRDAAVGREVAFAELLTRGLRLLIYVMIPIAVATAVARSQIVTVLFGGGRTSASDLQLVADTLVTFLIGLTAHAMIAVLARAFYARQDTLTPVAAAVAAVAINCTLAILLVGPLGLPGIALAIAIAAWLEALALLALIRRRVAHFELRGMTRVALEALAGSGIAGAAAFFGQGWITGAVGATPGRPVLAVEVALVGLLFGLVYVAVSLVLRIPELPSIVGVMVDVLRRPARS